MKTMYSNVMCVQLAMFRAYRRCQIEFRQKTALQHCKSGFKSLVLMELMVVIQYGLLILIIQMLVKEGNDHY